MRWSDLELDAGRVHVRQALKKTAEGKLYFEPPKTETARREVGLPGWALDAVRAHRKSLGAVPLPSLRVFTSDDGTPVDFGNFHVRAFRQLAKRAGVPDATFHALRHTFATLLLGSGVDIKTAQTALGHKRASITIDTYAHAIPGNLDRATATLDALIGGAGKP